ncbi:MAG TPA: 3-phosphoshikimate 1-carboxyvinyltransferase [Longimicrobium sp.]
MTGTTGQALGQTYVGKLLPDPAAPPGAGALVEVAPLHGPIAGTLRVPSSKPDTQRALVTAALAGGRSVIHNDLRCQETEVMKDCLRALGAGIREDDGWIEVTGTGGRLSAPGEVLRCAGSALAFRTLLALACGTGAPVILTGDAVLRRRVMAPLFAALRGLGAELDCIGEENLAPVVNWGSPLRGGRCILPADGSSQFATAVLLAAPRAQGPVEITLDGVEGGVLSASYIRQTLDAMRRAGVEVEASESLGRMTVRPCDYHPFECALGGDYTSASYLLALAALFPGTLTLTNLEPDGAQGERKMLDVVRELGVELRFEGDVCQVSNDGGGMRGDHVFDLGDAPNILPTVAALAAFVEGRCRIVGGRLTNHHKSPRILSITEELRKAGVAVEPVYRGGELDGMEIRGRASYEGGVAFSSWGDHRIAMSLALAALRMREPSRVEGVDLVGTSYPGFFDALEEVGARCDVDGRGVEAAEGELAQVA